MTFPTTAELEEEETEIVTADITKEVGEEEVVIATTEAMITQEEAMTKEEAITETTPEKEVIADMSILTLTDLNT